MSRKADFLKKVAPRTNRVTLDWQTQGRNCTSKHKSRSRQKDTLIRKEDIEGFRFIGIFDKKVIVTFHNSLGLFGYFDFHAIHERIRYEYYSSRIKASRVKSTLISCFDTQAIEKEGKIIKQPFGTQTKVLIKVSKTHLALFGEDDKKTQVWGIQLQRNNHDEVFITSFKPILGKDFSPSELQSIIQQEIMLKGTKLPQLIDSWVAEYSCKSAYKFNDSLNRTQAVMLIKNLSKCEFPWFCVHGRNTIHTSSSEQLSH